MVKGMGVSRRLVPGDMFASRFQVERLLAQGSMGSVYLVRDSRSGEERALKLMSPDLMAEPRFTERFEQEAGIGARIESEHVVRVFEHGVDESSGLPWLAMEYLVGETLERELARSSPSEEEAHELLRQLFDALAAAHSLNVVHRDLKPENVLIVRAEGRPARVKVLDFGVAKVVRETTMSATAAGLGTPLWTAPEQGLTKHMIRPSADVWALGLITFRLLAGKMFWRTVHDKKASTMALAIELLREPIPLATVRARELGCTGRLPRGFDAWFAHAVARNPRARFTSAGEAYSALAPLLGDADEPAPETLKRPKDSDRVVLPMQGITWWPWLAIALVIVTAVLVMAAR